MDTISLRALPIATCLGWVLIAPVTTAAQTCSAPWLYTPFATCEHSSHGVESYRLARTPACGIDGYYRNLRVAGTHRTVISPRQIGQDFV